MRVEETLIKRRIARVEVLATLAGYEFRVADRRPPNEVLMRRSFDPAIGRKVLMRLVIVETPLEIAIVTVYKATSMQRYLRGLLP